MIIQALVQASLWGRGRGRRQLAPTPKQTRRITPNSEDKALLLLALVMFLGASCMLTWVLLLFY